MAKPDDDRRLPADNDGKGLAGHNGPREESRPKPEQTPPPPKNDNK